MRLPSSRGAATLSEEAGYDTNVRDVDHAVQVQVEAVRVARVTGSRAEARRLTADVGDVRDPVVVEVRGQAVVRFVIGDAGESAGLLGPGADE